jgi:hypothetical protein
LLIVLAAPPIASAAQGVASAKAFLQSAYSCYGKNGKGIDFTGTHASQFFHSSLLTLIDADITANGLGYVGVMDSDPICECQDWVGIWDLKIEVQMQDPNRALADVSFALFAPVGRARDDLRTLKYTLVPERGQWRIYNIVDESYPPGPFDLRKALEKDIASLRMGSKRVSATWCDGSPFRSSRV